MFAFVRKSAAVAPASAVGPLEPSLDHAVVKIRELHAHLGNLQAELAAAERAVALTVKNRETIELGGDNPDAEIQRRRVALDQVRRRLANAKNDLARAFVDEGKRRAENHAEVWTRTYLEVVVPRTEKLAAALELMENTANEIIALLAPASAEMRLLEAIDEAADSWNLLCRECTSPGNAYLNVTPVTKTIFASFLQTIKFRQFEVVLSQLRDVLDPRPARPRITEERLAVERERAADESHRLRTAQELAQASEDAKIAAIAKTTNERRAW